MVRQKLNLVIHIIKQYTRTKLISRNSLKIYHIFVHVSFEGNCFFLKIDTNRNNISFCKFKCLNKNISTLIELFWSALILLQLPPLALII